MREQGHRVYAATFHPTHLHVVFGPLNENVKTVVSRLKRRTAERVLAVRRNRGEDLRHLWTVGQYPVFIYDDEHLHNAIEYVRRHNVRIGREADPYEWIKPLFPPR